MAALMPSAFVLVSLLHILCAAATLDAKSTTLKTLFSKKENVSFLEKRRLSDKSKHLFEERFCKDDKKQPLPHDQLPVCFEMRFIPKGRVLEALAWVVANTDTKRFAGWY